MRARSGTESSGFHPTSLPLRLATAVAGVALACGLAIFYFASTPPERAFAPFQSLGDYPIASMRKAMQVQGVSEEHEAIVRLGSRFMGQPGWDKAVAYVRAAYERAGLEIYEQEFDVVAPKTAYREILRVNDDLSEPLREVVIYPFMPNQMQPVVAPGDGITGKLILLDEATLNTRERFDDCIGLIDSREGHFARNFGFDWTRYANLGVKALIVSHSEGLEKAPWIAFSRHRGSWAMVSGLPVNYVRLAATKEIFHYLGEDHPGEGAGSTIAGRDPSASSGSCGRLSRPRKHCSSRRPTIVLPFCPIGRRACFRPSLLLCSCSFSKGFCLTGTPSSGTSSSPPSAQTRWRQRGTTTSFKSSARTKVFARNGRSKRVHTTRKATP